MKPFIALSLAVLSLTASASERFSLVADGQAEAQIVTGAQPPETVVFAAKELQAFVKKMSGAELPIASKPVPGTPAILLGPAAREKLPPAELEEIKRDGYLITVANGDLCIVGIDDAGAHTDIEALLEKGETHSVPSWSFHRGTLYGVYRLLEELGMRWFMPGEFGERAPDIKSLAFAGDIRENPHFISRTVGYWSMGIYNGYRKDYKSITVIPGERNEIGFTPVDNRMWELRMRGATYQIPLNHYPTSTRWVERFGKTHPEYFALLGGTRDHVDPLAGHLCYTCPGVIDESVADIKAYAAGKESEDRGISRLHPVTQRPLHNDNRGWPEHIAFGEYFSLLPHDGFRACTCPNCLKKMELPEVKLYSQRHSKLVWDYIAQCATRAPDQKITCLAYTSFSVPYPGMPELPPNVTVGYCGYSHPASLYYKDGFQRYEKLVNEWSSLSHGNLAFWQHYLASNRDADTVGMPEHTPEMYARVIRVMAKHGTHVFCEQMNGSIMFELYNRYLLLKMFYNPQLDERAIWLDFLTRFYGPAGGTIGEIYADIGARNVEKIRQGASAVDYWTKFYTADALKSYHAKAAEAAEQAAGTPYEQAVSAFDRYYLGLMDVGRAHFKANAGEVSSAPNPDLTCRYDASPFTVDGTADKPRWTKLAAIPMNDVNTGKPGAFQAEVKSCYDEQYIYFLITAYDPDAQKLSRVSGEPGTVDGIEIFLDTQHNHLGYYQMTFDLAGHLDERHYIDKIEPVRIDWKSNAKWQTVVNDDRYVMEIALPRKSLECEGRDLSEETWGVLVGRTISAMHESACRFTSTSTRLRRGFHQPALFNNLIFEK